MSHEKAERRPGLGDGMEQRSASSLLFQTLGAVGDVGVGTGTALLGAAAWKKVTGSDAPEQQSTPPAESPSRKQAE
jgi:hypothetical protein